jgi:hypothetical protein
MEWEMEKECGWEKGLRWEGVAGWGMEEGMEERQER